MVTKLVNLNELKVANVKCQLDTSGTAHKRYYKMSSWKSWSPDVDDDSYTPMFETSCGSSDLSKLLEETLTVNAKTLEGKIKLKIKPNAKLEENKFYKF